MKKAIQTYERDLHDMLEDRGLKTQYIQSMMTHHLQDFNKFNFSKNYFSTSTRRQYVQRVHGHFPASRKKRCRLERILTTDNQAKTTPRNCQPNQLRKLFNNMCLICENNILEPRKIPNLQAFFDHWQAEAKKRIDL